MAPRTRRSKTIVVTDNPQLTIAENQAQLDSEASTHSNVGNIRPQRQTVRATTTAINPNLKRKSQLFSVRPI